MKDKKYKIDVYCFNCGKEGEISEEYGKHIIVSLKKCPHCGCHSLDWLSNKKIVESSIK